MAGADWALTTAAISSLAPAAVATYYGKNTAKSLGLVLGVTGAVSLLWGLIGYSMVYGKPLSTGVIGTETYGTVDKVLNSNTSFVNVLFELNFLLTTLAIIAGAVGEVFQPIWFVLFSLAYTLLVWTPQAMWQWNPLGWASTYGIVDQAGGLIVHTQAGLAALVLGYLLKAPAKASGASQSESLLSIVALFFATFALNAGKYNASLSLLNTYFAAAAGIVTYGAAEVTFSGEKYFKGAATLPGAAKGALLGLVASSAGAGLISPMFTILVSFIATLFVFLAAKYTKSYTNAGWEIFLNHGFGGALSVTLTGLFADKAFGGINGSFYRNAILLGKQCAGVSYVILMTVVATAVLFVFTKLVAQYVFGSNVQAEEEAAPAEGAKAPSA